MEQRRSGLQNETSQESRAAEHAALEATRAALRLAEDRLSSILQSRSVWLWESDIAHRFTVFLGPGQLDRAAVIGKTRFENAADQEDTAKWAAHRANLEAHLPFEDFQYTTLREGLGLRHIRASGVPLFDKNGEFLGYRGTATDITETVTAAAQQQELREDAERSRQQLRDAIETISDGFVLYDADDRLVMFNRRYHDEFSFGPDALVPGTKFIDILRHGVATGRVPFGYDAEKWIEERMAAHLEPPPPYLVERADGRWTLMTEHRTRDRGLVGIRTDVTELKQQERAAHENERLMRELIDAVPALVQTKDKELRYHLVNQYFLDVWNMTLEDVVGKTQEEAFQNDLSPYYGKQATDRDHWVLENKRPTGMYEISYPRADGRTLTLWAHKLPLLDEDGEVFRILTIGMDISDLKAAQKKIEEQREALHQSEKLSALGELLASVAHELNNPLSVVVGQAMLMQETAQDPRIVHRAEKIGDAAARCSHIVKAFLAMAREQPLARTLLDPNEVLEAGLELCAYTLRDSGIRVIRRLAADLPRVDGDRNQLAQVITNLILNARYALQDTDEAREIKISSSYRPLRSEVVLKVKDNGPGVPEAVRGRIFEPLFTTKEVGAGTGIGLALCHRIVAAHRGSLYLESPPEGGASFCVRLPVASVSAADGIAPAAHASDPGRLRVLVIEDEPDVAEMLADIVQAGGHEVSIAHSAANALELLNDRAFDVVLSDVRMPGLDGPRFFEQLKQSHPPMQSRVIFVTGDTLSPRARAFLQRSGRPYLEKPVRPAELRELLARVNTEQGQPTNGERR